MIKKRIMLALNILFIALIAAGAACYCVFEKEVFKVLTSISVVLIAALNMKFKNKNLLKSIFTVLAFVLFAVATFLISIQIDRTLVLHYSASATLIVLGMMAYLAGVLIETKFDWKEIIYAVAIFIPVSCVMLFSSLFGFKNGFVAFLNIVYMAVVSYFVAKAFANLVKKQNATNILMFIASIFMFIFNFLFMLNKFAYLSIIFVYIIIGTFYLSQILLLCAYFDTFRKNEETENKPEKTGIKRSILYSVSLCLATLLAGFAVSSSFYTFNLSNAKMTKAEFLSEVGDDLNIPLIEINTENNKLPHDKENYVNCSFEISNCEAEKDNFKVEMGVNEEGDYSVGIRLRGNSTLIEKKKPYRIKFSEKKSLFGLKANKSWVLLADYLDQSSVRNYAAFTLANGIIDTLPEEEQYFAPTGHHVAVVINGQFKGLFLLCEQMDENKGRAAVKDDAAFENIDSKTEFPFFIEMDGFAFKEGKTGVDNFYITEAHDFSPVEIKYPESDERGATETSDKVFDYISEYMNAVCKLIQYGGTTTVSFRENPVELKDLVDLDTFIDYYLITEIMYNNDSIWKSIYFSKTTDGLLKMGPIWDFDFSMADSFDLPYDKSCIESANKLYIAKHSSIFSGLFNNESFFNEVAIRYDEIKHVILDVSEHLKTYKAKIDSVALVDAKLWYNHTSEFQYDMQYDYVRLFLQDRYTYLDDVFNKTYAEFRAL